MRFRHWLHLIRGGNLTAQIPALNDAEFAEIAEDLNVVGNMLLQLSENTELQLQKHTQHITQKTHSLQVLYGLAAKINLSVNLDDLLSRFLSTISDLEHVEAAAVRLLEGNTFKLKNSCGLEKFKYGHELELKIEDCQFGTGVCDGNIVWEENVDWGNDCQCDATYLSHIGIVSVPLLYRDHTLGVFNLFINLRSVDNKEELNSLFLSIGQHGGMAIEKARLDAEAHRLRIMDEREHLSHELHDSLAQTLVSLRFQTRVLSDMFHVEDKLSVDQQLERIDNTVDEANTELRELITYFRAPIDKRGVLVAVQQLVRIFQEENDISIFLQKEWPELPLPSSIETQVLRIIQEALANIRKHSKAQTVRILLRGNELGHYYILIEDDGIGFERTDRSYLRGEHIGLDIMHERAGKFGGSLNIDSEIGEGTRVVLKFNFPTIENKLDNNLLPPSH